MKVQLILVFFSILLFSCKYEESIDLLVNEGGTNIVISEAKPDTNFILDELKLLPSQNIDHADANRILIQFVAKEKLVNIKIDSVFLILEGNINKNYGENDFYLYPLLDSISFNTNWRTQPKINNNQIFGDMKSFKGKKNLDLTKLYMENPVSNYNKFTYLLKLKNENSNENISTSFYSSKIIDRQPKLKIYYKQL